MSRLSRDREILERFIAVACRKRHGSPAGELCADCGELLRYALRKLERCPYEPKPKCKECPTHCFRPDYRQRIREVMRFAGIHYVKRGRVDWLVRYFL